MRTSNSVGLILATLLLTTAAPEAEAQEVPTGSLDLVTERVMTFKDGYALVVKRGSGVADENGEVHSFELPKSVVLGTFWAWSADQPVLGMRSETVVSSVEEEARKTVESTAELLEANLGRALTLVRDGERFEGVLLAVLAGGQPTAVLETTEGSTKRTRALPIAQLLWIEGAELTLEVVRTSKEERSDNRLSIGLGREAAGEAVSVHLVYFTPDVRWIPTYRLSGPLETAAELSLQGELLNELEDLSGAELDLVVGVPHFRFRDTISPLSLESGMRSALSQAAPQLMSQALANNAVFSNSFANRSTERAVAAPPDLPDELQGGESGDLYVFSIGPRRFPKGSRLTVPLFSAQVELRHLYTLDLDVGHDAQSRRYLADARERNESRSPLTLGRTKVWHQLELDNATAYPWTTGAALVLRTDDSGAMLPLGQDLLTYTPRGGTCELPVTVAVNVRSRHEEVETARVPNDLLWDGDRYTRIEKRGSVTLTNSLSESIDLRVRVGTGGAVSSTSHDGVVRRDDYRAEDWRDSSYHWRVNPHSDISWELTLDPGEKRELTYDFAYHVR